ncbi:cell wall-binding repeat-containing protein [Salipaludibacillus agaradhaerens]|uniref:Cell wall-binding repeat-containing protein n=1 Tax=Salipaludibacillus agaradhaerens TaxID=76935 RepID=A0A9Q4B462_SALAG|nr:cell wall-binding repeat-containing protein [Salipaludibacillus agaradhaerens]MCR6098009.1 cell wall-binding repeat-containing protein [Salipaludibacillus agaradhaerens]MCR6116362.1 cell wall-binding repeat-containing protein [Salipaludibacillus agaradhaerens]
MGKKRRLTFVTLTLLLIMSACANPNEEVSPDEKNENDTHDMEQNNKQQNEMDINDHGHDEDQHHDFASPPDKMNPLADESVHHAQTKNVTRLDTASELTMSIYVSQLIWPATHDENRPNTVIIAPLDDWQKSLVSTTLIHHPNDGPILFMEDGQIEEEVAQEIERLQPKGNNEGVELMVIGDMSEETRSQLEAYRIEELNADNNAAFAAKVDQYFSDIIQETPKAVLIGSSEEEAQLYTMIASNWIAHMNESLLYVNANGLPDETREALEKRGGEAAMYVLGDEETISDETLTELAEFGEVERIAGNTPEQMAIEFAKYRDEDTHVGWGQTTPGHGFSFVSSDKPEMAIAGASLGHLGKHAPLIWLKNNNISDDLFDYLAEVRPTFEDNPMAGPYNHSYLLADQTMVPFQVQGILDEKLEISGAHGDH